MAKEASKGKQSQGLEAVGWGFWLICFVVLYGPAWYIGYSVSYSDQRGGLLPWVLGFVLAAFGAGIVSVAVNFTLQKRIELQKKRARKKRS